MTQTPDRLPGTPSALIGMAFGPTVVLLSSASLSWPGILLEKHRSSPGEWSSAANDKHMISMVTSTPLRFEHRDRSGQFVPGLNCPGSLMITSPGPAPDIRTHSLSEIVHCALDEHIVYGVLTELEAKPVRAPMFRPCVRDVAMKRLLELLAKEAEAKNASGKLYVDSLAHAIATRYLMLEYLPAVRSVSRVSVLPPRLLDRVRQKIDSNLDADLSLADLAEETGYSRAHFIRMFRAATGFTPYQYVLDLRLKRARELLRNKDEDIIDIAHTCGFAGRSHMTGVFRRRLHTTPSLVRRNA